jgi:hypothetical protein
MAARLEATGGGALDNLEGHPEVLAATFRLQGGDVLQRYVRDADATGPGARPPGALAWKSRPTGAMHWLKQFLALEPIYVESPVQLSKGLTGTVSILVDHHWIWNHAVRRAQQTPIALLLGFLVALVAANALRRQVVEPLAQLAQTTRVNQSLSRTSRARPPPQQRAHAARSNFDAL